MKLCSLCGLHPSVVRGRCDDCIGVHHVIGARIHPTTPFDQDLEAQRFVEEHPGGATMAEVAEAFGVTRQRIEQIERRALVRMRARMQLVGYSARDIAEHLGLMLGRQRGVA